VGQRGSRGRKAVLWSIRLENFRDLSLTVDAFSCYLLTFLFAHCQTDQYKISLFTYLLIYLCNTAVCYALCDCCKFNVTDRGVRNVVKCRLGTRIDFERVPGYPFER